MVKDQSRLPDGTPLPEMEKTSRLGRIRKRRVPHGTPAPNDTTEYYYNGNVTRVTHTDYDVSRSDYYHYCSDTYKNPQFDQTKYGRPPDDGGPLTLYKVEWVDDLYKHYDFWTANNAKHRYGICNLKPGSSYTDSDGINPYTAVAPPNVDLSTSVYGPELWSRMRPDRPSVGLGIFLGESKDLPKLLYARLASLKDIGDWWLAVQFGWIPLLNDIIDMIKTVLDVSKQIDFILKNAGKPLRRSAKLGTQVTTDALIVQTGATAYGSSWLSPKGLGAEKRGSIDYGKYSQKLTRTITRDVWGSGLFTFTFSNNRIPKPPEILLRLLGLKATPEVVWELLPWSWLIDWFTNIGDVISNMSHPVADDTYSIYAYACMHTTRTYTWTATDGYLDLSLSRRFESKVRDKIHPFGLAGGTPLTDRQKSILAAIVTQKL